METTGSEHVNWSISELIQNLYQHFLSLQNETLPSRIVDVADTEQEIAIRKAANPPIRGRLVEDTIHDAVEIFSHRIAMDHPHFFGFIPSPVHPISCLGDIMTIMFNTHAGSWFQSSGPSAVEDALTNWLCQQAGLPPSAGGIFVSGGSMANLSAIIMARDQRLSFEERQRGIIYLSEETHSSLEKGLLIAGFPKNHIRKIKSDTDFRLSTEDLSHAISSDRKAGLIPFLLIATCGYTNTGVVDPLQELAEISEREKLWLHVDGAYGASILLSQRHKSQAEGIGRADSISWDAHKWLFQTYACGMLLVRDKSNLVKTFTTNASYIQDADEISSTHVNFWNRGIELTRPARAMKLWFTLQVLGLEKMDEMISHGILLAEGAEGVLRGLTDWEVVTPARLAIVNFRYLPPRLVGQSGPGNDLELERINTEISRRAIAQNVAAPLTTRLKGRLNIRICAIHPSLTESKMEEIVHSLDDIARQVDIEMQTGRLQSK